MEQKPNSAGPISVENELERTQAKLNQLRDEFQEFVYTVSHDMSGPLRHASGFAEMVLENNDKILDEKYKKFLNQIIKSSEDGKKSLDLLREYSRLNVREKTVEDDISLTDVLENIEIRLKALLEESGATLKYDMLPSVTGDRALLTQLFENLITNSILYQDGDSKPLIQIVSNTHSDAWSFSIADNGIGIPDNRLEFVFKVFKRAVKPAEYSGDGMGLTMAKKIVEKHNGKIWFEPALPEGSKINFTISKTD